MSVVMTVCDVGDEVIIFTPYYFNHLMALQLINAKVSGASILIMPAFNSTQ
jgi:aspartate/methionine/tyrosine aminotransferase